MSATIEERLARYTARLDQAASDYSARPAPNALLTTPEHRPVRAPGRGPGRRLVAAAVVACVVAVAGFAISSSHSKHGVDVSTVTSDTIGPATTAANSTTSTTSEPTTTTIQKIIPPPPGTTQITYEPFTGNDIDPRLHVTQRLGGTCVSPASGLHTAYRCFADGGAIYDPCFADSHGTADPLVCPNDPVGPDVVELTARSNTPYPPGTAAANPWEIELATGQLCRLVAAAWGTGGPYSCDKTGVAQPVADCHVPVRSQPWWTAECQEQLTDSSPFASTRVVKVWY